MLYNRTMKIGIYGGTFDPIHLGHITIAKAVLGELGLNKVYFMVAADPPHKPNSERTPASVRFEMAKLTLKNIPGLIASDLEIRRGGKSYTVETLAEMKKRFKGAELYFIVGADMLANFPTWYQPAEILRLAKLAAVQREGQAEDLPALAEAIKAQFGGEIVISNACGPEISSTEVRTRIAEARPIRDITARKTELYIYENLLYAPKEILEIRDRLAERLEPSRLRHSLLTAREAVLIADRYGLDTKKAYLCGLIHDCAKLKTELLDEKMARVGFCPTEEEKANPYLIHARLGAICAKADFGIDDPEILRAIELHTLGAPDMTPFDEVIFLADKLEPSRDYRRITPIRRLAGQSLDAAVAAVLRNNIAYMKSREKPIHPTTNSTLQAIESRIKNKKQNNHTGG